MKEREKKEKKKLLVAGFEPGSTGSKESVLTTTPSVLLY